MISSVWKSGAIVLAVSMVVHAQEPVHQHAASTRADGPPMTLASVLNEALEKNPELAALRDQIAVARQRPAQERALLPPMAEAQIWQWPSDSLNPANSNMYMLMVGAGLPGRGKRDAARPSSRKTPRLSVDVTIRARQIDNEIKQAYAALFIARKAARIHLDSVEVLNQIADAARSSYASGKGSQADA